MLDHTARDSSPQDRRRFFAAGLARLFLPLADYVERRLPALLTRPEPLPRPPGAIEEDAFLRTCYRCGSCADSCPASAIALAANRGEDVDGTPYISAPPPPCDACEGRPCATVCPSGALKHVSTSQNGVPGHESGTSR